MPKLKKMRLSRDLPGVNLYRKDKFAFVFRNIGLTGVRVKTDPAFHNTRLRATDFAQAAKIASLLYHAMLPEAAAWNGRDCYRRLLSLLVKRAPANTTQPYIDKPFHCNPYAPSQPDLCNFVQLHYDDFNNAVSATLRPIDPIAHLNFPIGATHFRLSLLLKATDQQTGQVQKFSCAWPAFYRIAPSHTKPLLLTAILKHTNPSIAITFVHIEFFHSTDNELYTFNHHRNDILDTFILPATKFACSLIS